MAHWLPDWLTLPRTWDRNLCARVFVWGFSGGEFGGENSWFPLSCKDTRFESTGKFRSPFLGHAHSPIQQQQRHKFTFVINQEHSRRGEGLLLLGPAAAAAVLFIILCVCTAEKNDLQILPARQRSQYHVHPVAHPLTHSLARPPTYYYSQAVSQLLASQPVSEWYLLNESQEGEKKEAEEGCCSDRQRTHSTPNSTHLPVPPPPPLLVNIFFTCGHLANLLARERIKLK